MREQLFSVSVGCCLEEQRDQVKLLFILLFSSILVILFPVKNISLKNLMCYGGGNIVDVDNWGYLMHKMRDFSSQITEK